jgi:hypothetical protein
MLEPGTMTHGMSRWIPLLVGPIIAAPVVARAAPAPVTIATCGDSKIEVVAGSNGGAGELHGLIVAPGGNRWGFIATVSMARLGAKTRTVTVEDVRTQERTPARGDKDVAPSGLFVDLLLDDKKLILRHASEGAPDPAYAVDLDKCSFQGDAAIAAIVPPPAEPVGCAAATVRGAYRTQVTQAAKLPEADADREAQALCEDHQKTIDARTRLEQAISDRSARDRLAARGSALLRIEDNRLRAWSRIDGCLGADPAKAKGVAALHDGEAKLRACYAKIAAKP